MFNKVRRVNVMQVKTPEKQEKHHSEQSFLRRAFYSYPSFHLHQIFKKEKNKERRRDKN